MRLPGILASIVAFLLVGCVGAVSLVHAYDQTSSSFHLEDGSISLGGGYASSLNFQSYTVVNEIGGDKALSASYTSNTGTIYTPSATSPVVSVTTGIEELSISWGASVATYAEVTSYEVGIATSSSGPFTYTNTGLTRSKVYTSLTGGTTYYVQVRVYDGTTLLVTSSVVSGIPTANSGGSGGGGGGGSPAVGQEPQTSIQITGRAYPKSQVTVLRDGIAVATTVAGEDAQFSVTASQGAGNYLFGVYTTDYSGRRSTVYTFMVGLTEGTSTSVGGIFFPPTIAVERRTVEWGESLPILGQGAPESTVNIYVYSTPRAVQTTADKDGFYLYAFDTTPLEIGAHETKAKSMLAAEASALSDAATFQVVEKGDLPAEELPASLCRRADINCDGKVDLVDFSIAAFWYHRPLEGVIREKEQEVLNGDGKMDLIDMSIIAYAWTG